MAVAELLRETHEHLTWLTGALARALMARAETHAGIVPMLQRLAACDFSSAMVADGDGGALPAELAPHLPQALLAALEEAQEVAMALAAAQEHLRWRRAQDGAAMAEIVGPRGALRCARGHLRLLLAAPACPLNGASCGNALLLLLAGNGGLTAPTGNPVWRQRITPGTAMELPGDMLLRVEGEPLLAALFS